MQWFPVKHLMVRSNHNYLSAVVVIWGGAMNMQFGGDMAFVIVQDGVGCIE